MAQNGWRCRRIGSGCARAQPIHWAKATPRALQSIHRTARRAILRCGRLGFASEWPLTSLEIPFPFHHAPLSSDDLTCRSAHLILLPSGPSAAVELRSSTVQCTGASKCELRFGAASSGSTLEQPAAGRRRHGWPGGALPATAEAPAEAGSDSIRRCSVFIELFYQLPPFLFFFRSLLITVSFGRDSSSSFGRWQCDHDPC